MELIPIRRRFFLFFCGSFILSGFFLHKPPYEEDNHNEDKNCYQDGDVHFHAFMDEDYSPWTNDR